MTDEQFAQAWARRHALLHTALVSYRYHRKRQRFFDLADKTTKAATVLGGATLLSEFVKAHLPVAAAVIAGLGLLSLVFGYGDRKQAHKELGEAFMAFAADIESAGQTTFTQQQLAAWEAALMRLNGREPPALHALVTVCENEQAVAAGHPELARPLPWHQRMLADWVSFA